MDCLKRLPLFFLLLSLLAVPVMSQEVLVSEDFSEDPTDTWSINGSATWDEGNQRVVVTPATGNQAGSVFYNVEALPIDNFRLTAEAKLCCGSGADGMTITFLEVKDGETVADVAGRIGQGGGGMCAAGLTDGKQITVEFDIWGNSGACEQCPDDTAGGRGANHLGVEYSATGFSGDNPDAGGTQTDCIPASDNAENAACAGTSQIGFDLYGNYIFDLVVIVQQGYVMVDIGCEAKGVPLHRVITHEFTDYAPFDGVIGVTASTGGANAEQSVYSLLLESIPPDVCLLPPGEMERTLTTDITRPLGEEELPAYEEGTPVGVSLELTSLRGALGACTKPPKLTVEEVLPPSWSAENIAPAADLADGVITWNLADAQVAEGQTLTYDAIPGPEKSCEALFSGSFWETDIAEPLVMNIGGTNAIIPSEAPLIDPDGYFQSWLVLGPLDQGGGANPGEAVYEDYLATTAPPGHTEENVIPAAGMEMPIEFAAASSTDVKGPTPNGQNPGAAEDIATWFVHHDPDSRLDHNTVFGQDYDDFVAYHVCYLENTTASPIFLEAVAASDDTAVWMLDNTVISVTYWAGWAEDSSIFVLPPGEHRLLCKCFEGGGGNGIQLHLRDPSTGEFVTGDDMRINYSLEPAMTELPPSPTASVTRTLPYMRLGQESTVTLTIEGGAVDIYETVPGTMEITDPGSATQDGQLLTWADVEGSVSYKIRPAEEGGVFQGNAKEVETGAWLSFGGISQPFFPEEVAGWYHQDIKNPGHTPVAPSEVQVDEEYVKIQTHFGHDIWGTADEFHYVWRKFPSDSEIVMKARLDSFDPLPVGQVWSKAGIMVRTLPTQDSPFVFAAFRCDNGPGTHDACVQWRDSTGGGAGWDGFDPLFENLSLPYWIKVEYTSGTVVGSFAPDDGGAPGEWQGLPSHELNLEGSSEVLVGLALTSHEDNPANPIIAEFSGVTLPGGPSEVVGVHMGNLNADDKFDIADAIYLLNYLFGGGPEPVCAKAGDPNNDNKLDVADAISLLGYLFAGESITAPDGSQIGPDMSPGCVEYSTEDVPEEMLQPAGLPGCANPCEP